MAIKTTLALDDDLVAEAQRPTGISEKSALVRQALRALIEQESARSPSPPRRQRACADGAASPPPLAPVILVDTPVWVDHLRTGEPALAYLLDHGVSSRQIGNRAGSQSLP